MDEQVIGTYYTESSIIVRLHVSLLTKCVKKGLVTLPSEVKSDAERREDAYNMLASHVRANLDMEKIYDMLKIEVNR
ncbi:Cobyric acid synthase OS=Lysinibacillus sphaericus OX=1421 GN=cobQ PE=3 SV=1 [Lysinibacillus sphaericus]